MANTPITELDFDAIKASLRNHFTSQGYFTDYDFEGSALSVLIDVMAYNTHYMGFYANMVANEMFLDSAVKRQSAVSLAKHLGYTPSSIKSSSVVVDIKTGESYASNTYLPAYTVINGGGYSFVSLAPVLQTEDTDGNGIYSSASFTEGEYRTTSYLFDTSVADQKLRIPDLDVDTSTIRLVVQTSTTDPSGVSTPWTLASDITSLTSSSEAYFLQESRDGFYEIYFGDGVLGKKPSNGNVITIAYVVSSGEESNGLGQTDSEARRTFASSVGTVEVVTPASGGAERQTKQNVKFTAPLSYQAQNRNVTENDYVAAVRSTYANAESVSVYGGETSVPPQYGKVFVSIKPNNGLILTDTEKASILSALQSKNLVSITPEIVDAEYLYLNVNCLVTYDPTKTTLSSEGIRGSVISAILDHGDNRLEKFNEDYINSRLSRVIDFLEQSIIGNQLTISMEKRITPILGSGTGNTVRFRNKIFHPHDGHIPVITSNTFQHKNSSGSILNCYFTDDGYGIINLFTSVGGSQVLVASNIGTVDYDTGILSLNSTFVPVGYVSNDYISITAKPSDQDVLARENTIITIDSFDDSVTCSVITSTDRRDNIGTY